MFRRLCISLLTLAAAFLPAITGASPSAAPTWRAFVSTHPVPFFYQAPGIAVGGSGNIFLADSGDHRVRKFSPDGRLLALWGTDTPGPLYFADPRSIAVDSLGYVYLADSGVVKLSSSGRVLARWTSGPLANAAGVAVAPDRTVYAVSLHPVPFFNGSDRMTVSRLSPTGRILASWVFSYPNPPADAVLSAAIAVAPTGNVVLSIAAQRHCHSCDGTYYQLWELSPSGKKIAQWDVPTGGAGFAVDAVGAVYLTAPGKIEKFLLDPTRTVLTPTVSWGSPGCGPDQLGDYLRLAVGSQGTVYVADSQSAATYPASNSTAFRAGVLHAFSSAGASLAFYGRCPTNRSRFFGQISGISIAPSGLVYVADESLARIDAFTLDGTLQHTLPAGNLPFVATDSHSNVYVPDFQQQTFEKRSPSGALLARVSPVNFEDAVLDRYGYVYGVTSDGMVQILRPINASRTTPGIVRQWRLKGYTPHQGGMNPSGIALDAQGNIYVADTRFDHVQKFSSGGRLLGIWGGRQGSAPGLFRRPTGIAVDTQGHVYVLDSQNNRVQEFDVRGRLLAVLGRKGQGIGQLNGPAGIAVDAHGKLYVGDNFNDRVQEIVVSR